MAAAGELRVRVTGACMEPHLRDGALVDVAPRRTYWPGDVVAFVEGTGRLVAHRVIGYRPGRRGFHLWTQADASQRPDAPIAAALVLGRVVATVSLAERARAISRWGRHLLLRLNARGQ
jgi:hypothetical protein